MQLLYRMRWICAGTSLAQRAKGGSIMKKKLTVLVLLILIAALMPDGSHAADEIQPKKKGRMWLIPVLAGAGFAAGMLVGLSAFDGSINAEKKIWNTAAISAVGGGIAGWLIGRPKARKELDYGLPSQKFEIRRIDPPVTPQTDPTSILLDNDFSRIPTSFNWTSAAGSLN